MVASIGGVLAGAIFGDHCSPISDTTVLSSQASGCNHVAHVWTQMPYALLVALVSIACGTLPVGFGLPVGPCLLAGSVALVGLLLLLGSKVPHGAAG
jgi:Na+/H+ antiporter NhaC